MTGNCISIKKCVIAAFALVVLVTVFFLGSQHGYDLGFTEGQNRANGWWIDKKSRYYESAKVLKKRIRLKYNQV